MYDSRAYEKALIIREEHEPILKLAWSRIGFVEEENVHRSKRQCRCFSSSQLGYCLADCGKLNILSVSTRNFIHRTVQCK